MNSTFNQIQNFLIVISIGVGVIFLLHLCSLIIEIRWINKHKND